MKLVSMPLCQIATVHSGGGAPQEPSAFTSAGIPFIRAGSLPKLLDGAEEESLELLEPDVADQYGLRLFPAGTVLFAKSGMSATKGHVYRLRKPAYVVNHLAALVPHKPQDSAFLAHALRRFSPTVLIKDPAYPSIRLGDIESMEIRAPESPGDRERIAEILDKADALRAKRGAALKKLDELTQSIFLDMFGDPATNPKGWPMQAFGQVCETRLGKMLDQKQQTGEHRRPYLRNANVQWFRFDLSNLLEMDFDEDERRMFRLQPGDLLICEGGEPGRSAVWRGELEECYFQKALHRARPYPNLASPEYLAWLLWFLARRGKLSGVTSATIAHLTGEKLAILPTMLPPLALQREFAKRVSSLESLTAVHRVSLTDLDTLFASFQHRAFRGEL